jgi:hypothetical protein
LVSEPLFKGEERLLINSWSGAKQKYQGSRGKSGWEVKDWISGCARKTPLNCPGDGFRKLSGVRQPQTSTLWFNESMNILEECQNMCAWRTAAVQHIQIWTSGKESGCFLWFGDLVDIRVSVEKELEIYSRMAASEQPNLWINYFLILGPNYLQ